jgi:hypothetical protein
MYHYMRNKFILSGLACLTLGLAPRALADVLVSVNGDQEFPSLSNPTPLSGSTTYNTTLYVQQVTPDAGYYVDYITFTINAIMTGAGSASNPTGVNQTFHKQSAQDGEVSASLAGGTVLNDVLPTVHPSANDVVVTPGTTWSFSGVTGSASETSTYNFSSSQDAVGNPISGTALMNDFIGGSTVPVNITGTSLTAYLLDTGLSDTSSDKINVTLDVQVWEAQVVPEPATWMSAALLFGVVGLSTGRSLWRKRGQVV